MHLAWFVYMEPGKGFSILGDWGGIMERPRSADVLAQGGNDFQATTVLARWTGLASEDDLPYKTVPDQAAAGYANRVVLQDVFYLNDANRTSYGSRTKPSDEVWKTLIRDHGAISIRFYYHSPYYAPAHSAYYCALGGSAHPDNTSALVVGWDDDFPKTHFTHQPREDGAWLARHNWGTIWGDQGYFWISYECRSLLGGAVYRVARPEPSARIYQYDDFGWCKSEAMGSLNDKKGWMANVFTAGRDEALNAVSFYTTAANAPQSIH